MVDEVVDTTAVPVGETSVDESTNGGKTPESSTGSEEKRETDGTSASKDTPFDQNPKWKAARAAQKSLDGLLEAKGFSSIEDLTAALERGSDLEETLSGRELNAILEKAEILEKYEAHWAEDERKKLRETETPEDTITRLEREKKELLDNVDAEKSKVTQARDAETAIQTFNSEVKAIVGKQDLPPEYQEFAHLLLGADNPMLDVDPTDKKAFIGAASSMLEKVKAFEQVIIARHKAGKIEIPATPPSKGSEEPAPTETKLVIKNLKHAHQVALERLTAGRKQ